MSQEHLFLAASINGTGWSGRSARWPGTSPRRFADPTHYVEAARIAHRGVLDAVFVSDHPALSPNAHSGPHHVFDPIVLFSAITGAVPDIGFVLTASTTYNSPFNLARRLASLDAFSGGRLIWNAVSSFNPAVAANYGSEPLPPREERYRRAGEFLDVVKQLWASWDLPDELAPDGALWDEAEARPIDHHGEFYDVRGPLNVPVGPQGHPVIAQAGASQHGLDFAARHAELVYAPLPGKEVARDRARLLTERATAYGRDPDGIRLFPGLNLVIADTREEAYRRHEALQGVADEEGLIQAFLTRGFGVTPELPPGVGPDDPLDPAWFPVLTAEGVFGTVGHSLAVTELVASERLTLRQLVRRVDGSHRLIVGTPRDVAEGILDWWDDGLVAGFNLQLPVLPDDLVRFVDEVVPILQAAGATPKAYDGSTVRERLGLPDPRLTTPGTAAVAR